MSRARAAVRRVSTLVATAVCCGLSACRADGTTGTLPAEDDGWFAGGEYGTSVRYGASGQILSPTDGSLASLDARTGAAKWRVQVPPGVRGVRLWEGDRFTAGMENLTFSNVSIPATQILFGNARTGALERIMSPPTGSFVELYPAVAYSQLLDTVVTGLNGAADSVRWVRRFSRGSCGGRRQTCQFVSAYGAIGSTLFFRFFRDATAGGAVDQLWRIDADGRATSVTLPIVAEPSSNQPRTEMVSSADSLLLFGGEGSVYVVDATTLALRWRVLTSTLVPVRPNVTVEYSHATEDPVERTLRVAYWVTDTAKSIRALEGVVLRTSDGVVLRRSRLQAGASSLPVYVGACGTDGYAIAEADGTIRFARWDSGAVFAWRSAKLESALAWYLMAGAPPRFETTGLSTLIVRLTRTSQILGLNCQR